jgi:L-ascorbate metabolism protein UlaG (beta-lactamase superfamily)
MRARNLCLLLLTGSSLAVGAAIPNHQADIVETSKGPLKITPLYHGSVMLEFGGKVIHIDPWSQADYTGIPKADLIVITHTHADHMDAALLKTLRKESTVLLGPRR